VYDRYFRSRNYFRNKVLFGYAKGAGRIVRKELRKICQKKRQNKSIKEELQDEKKTFGSLAAVRYGIDAVASGAGEGGGYCDPLQ
jgi:hypothetical protein